MELTETPSTEIGTQFGSKYNGHHELIAESLLAL